MTAVHVDDKKDVPLLRPEVPSPILLPRSLHGRLSLIQRSVQGWTMHESYEYALPVAGFLPDLS